MRTRLIPKMLNDEVEEYLSRNDIMIVPVGTVEMHGGFPLGCETTISEAFALEMAEACDGLVLQGLPYFYAGATASGRGTVQVGVRDGSNYLFALAKNLARQGFKRQIYISAHGPAHMTIAPMIRDFMDETGIPILYIDLGMSIMKHGEGVFKSFDSFNTMTVGAYDMLGQLEDIPLTDKYEYNEPQTCSKFNELFSMAYQSEAIGYYFGNPKDHMRTPAIVSETQRKELAEEGKQIIKTVVERMDMNNVVKQMKDLDEYNKEVIARCPWATFKNM